MCLDRFQGFSRRKSGRKSEKENEKEKKKRRIASSSSLWRAGSLRRPGRHKNSLATDAHTTCTHARTHATTKNAYQVRTPDSCACPQPRKRCLLCSCCKRSRPCQTGPQDTASGRDCLCSFVCVRSVCLFCLLLFSVSCRLEVSSLVRLCVRSL